MRVSRKSTFVFFTTFVVLRNRYIDVDSYCKRVRVGPIKKNVEGLIKLVDIASVDDSRFTENLISSSRL